MLSRIWSAICCATPAVRIGRGSKPDAALWSTTAPIVRPTDHLDRRSERAWTRRRKCWALGPDLVPIPATDSGGGYPRVYVVAGSWCAAAAGHLIRGRSEGRRAGSDRGLLAACRPAHVAHRQAPADHGVVGGDDRLLLPVLRVVPGPGLRDGERPHRHRPLRDR